MLAKFKQIEESGIRQPMPEYNRTIDPLKDRRIGTAVELSREYDAMLLAYRERGEKPPKRFVLTEILAEKYGIAAGTVNQYIPAGRKYRREHGLD